MKDLFDLLDKLKLDSFQKIDDYCTKTRFDKFVLTLAEAFAYSSIGSDFISIPSEYNFSASMTLSGSNFPCEDPVHRIARVNELASFSALYADSTTIYNPFDFVYYFINPELSSKGRTTKIEEIKFRHDAIVALSISILFKPLLERGLLKYSRTIFSECTNCSKVRVKTSKELQQSLMKIGLNPTIELFTKNVKVIIPDKHTLILNGSESLLGEEIVYRFKKMPEKLLYQYDHSGSKISEA